MVWISWNIDLFWELRNNVLALESANTKSDIFRKPEYAYMQILSKDMIQAIELQEKAAKDVAYMRQLYVDRDRDDNDQHSTDRRKQTISALNHQMNHFESVLTECSY
jgi:transcription initiation factor IIF auxiliary subunit